MVFFYQRSFWATLLFLLIGVQLCMAQEQERCVFNAPDDQVLVQQRARLLRIKTRLANASATVPTTYIPIRVHIVRNSDGTGGVDWTTLPAIISRLNVRYAPMGIAFFLRGTTPHYINSTLLADFDVDEEDDLCTGNDVADAVNLYLIQRITYTGIPVAGYAYYPDTDATTNRIFCVSSLLLTAVTLQHEVGHYFNLSHTFQDNDDPDVSRRELVTRGAGANCSTTGDHICDTPADPYGLAGSSYSNCVYAGTAVDNNGAPFSPLLDNIMSYYGACRQNFTTGQYDWMSNGVLLRLDATNDYSLTAPGLVNARPSIVQLTTSSTGVQLTFQYSASDQAGFFIERATDPNGPFVGIGGVGPTETTFIDPSPVRQARNYYRIRVANSSQAFSDVWHVDIGVLYCVPTYSASAASTPAQIADFRISGTTLANSSAPFPTERYSDYTATPHLLAAGQLYGFLVNTAPNGVGAFASQHLKIWLDVNRDGTFANNEILYQTTAGSPYNMSLLGTLTIPASLSGQTGTFRLRVRTQYAADGLVSSPCDLYRYGETEDYSIRVTPLVCPPLNVTVLTTAVSCTGTNDGAVRLQATAGTSPFAYRLGATSNQSGLFTSLTAQNYSFTVTDAEGCSAVSTVSVPTTSCAATVQMRLILEGIYDSATGLMTTGLRSASLLPNSQPFTVAPWSYTGTEQATTLPSNVSAWLLLMWRNALGTIVAKQAVLVRNDGFLLLPDGSSQIMIPTSTSALYASFHHPAHLAVITSSTIGAGQLIDLTSSLTVVSGAQSMKAVGGGRYGLYAGDFDCNGIINNLDFNRWKTNGPTVNQYKGVDCDGNGVVNNLDVNLWIRNRSVLGVPLPY
ncbi:MAG: hypothetical protein EAZ91_22525 [Cytophagales bacterium]|nr:MAG: hypothetical protein EAZ91_22525 [Cytophagales bacterium]